MKLKEKTDVNKNFTKLTHKRGISLIVLIVTIIVIIILAAAVILTITKNNPVSSAKEATFKEDMANIQDELSMYISKKYTDNPTSFDKSSVNLSGDTMVTELPSTKKYKDKISVVEGKLTLYDDKVNPDEKKWFIEVVGDSIIESIRPEWQDTISKVKYGVPIPIGFTYKEGTKDTGLVIQDSNENEFVWIPVKENTYVKDTQNFGGAKISGEDSSLPNGITDEEADVKKYGGFYIGRYEAGVPEGDTSSSNKSGKSVSKKGATVWTDITYYSAKAKAEGMISTDYVQTGLITGKAWDTTCHWIEDSLENINESATLKNSEYYGNYSDSKMPADVDGYGTKQVAGFSENWKTKNIYDLAGNVEEWTNEYDASYAIYRGNGYIFRGGAYGTSGSEYPVGRRNAAAGESSANIDIGFRIRLYIK